MVKCLVILLLCVIISGCGENTQGKEREDVVEQQTMFCDISEVQIPSGDVQIEERFQDDIMQIDQYVLSGDGIYRWFVTKNADEQDTPIVWEQYYSFEKDSWSIDRAKDYDYLGETYHRGGVYVNTLGEAYSWMFTSKATTSRLVPYGKEADQNSTVATDPLYKIYAGGVNRKICFDSQNCAYVFESLVGKNSTKIYQFNEEFNWCIVNEIAGKVGGILQKGVGTPVYWYGEDADGNFTISSFDGKEILLKTKDIVFHEEAYAAYDGKGYLCIVSSNGMWLCENQKVQKVCTFSDSGYGIVSLYGLCRGKDGDLQAFVNLGDECLMLKLHVTDRNVVSERKEIILALSVENKGLGRAVASFNRQNKGYVIKTIFPESYDKLENFNQRLQLELATGKGPDIIAEELIADVDGYIRNGVLVQLSSEELDFSQCISPIRALYQSDTQNPGVPYDFSLLFVAYPEELVRDKEHVTIEDIMEMMEERQDMVLQSGLSWFQIILRYGLWDDSNCSYIDWENRTSYLNGEDFKKLVEFAEMHSDRHGEEAFLISPRWSISNFEGFYSMLGNTSEQLKFLGYPRKQGNGIYIETSNLYLNSNCTNKEGALEFLQFLLSEKGQRSCASYDSSSIIFAGDEIQYVKYPAFPVNESVFLEKCKKEEKAKIGVVQNNEYIEISKYTADQFHEFYFMLEHAQICNRDVIIEKMVWEELEPYIEGQYQLDEALENLNSRVQLYLDEQ